MNRAVEYIDVHSSTPPRRVSSPDEPATLVDVFTGIARNHKRPDTLNYKRDGRWGQPIWAPDVKTQPERKLADDDRGRLMAELRAALS